MAPLKLFHFGEFKTAVYAFQQLHTLTLGQGHSQYFFCSGKSVNGLINFRIEKWYKVARTVYFTHQLHSLYYFHKAFYFHLGSWGA